MGVGVRALMVMALSEVKRLACLRRSSEGVSLVSTALSALLQP